MGKTIAETTKPKKVAIMGFAPSWKETPFADESFEVWTLNEAYKLLQTHQGARVDRWFEIHDPQSPSKNNKDHQEFLKACPVPLFMQKHYPEFPNSVAYPRDEIKKYFNQNFIINDIGSPFCEYSNQISWMTALAIYEGYEEIHIYGVDMAQKSEYHWQRSSCNFFIGYAAGKGIKVLIPKTSELCKFGQDYGFETDNQARHYKKGRKKELQTKIKQHQAEIEKLTQQKKQIDAAINQHTTIILQVQGAIGEIDHDLENHII